MACKYQTFVDLLYASYSGLQTLGFAFAKGKQRVVISGWCTEIVAPVDTVD